MSVTHLIADPHFGHESIIRMCARPFADVREMNHTMAANWRAVVRPNDHVIVLGDFAHRMPAEDLRKLFASLPGNKHLVVGNHDGKDTLALPWKSIRDIAFVSIDSQRVVLCHYALRSWPDIRRGALMLFGHHHGRLASNSRSCDIGVDVFGYTPLRLSQIKARLAVLPPLIDPEGRNDFTDGVTP